MKPRASAPASTAPSASSRLVMPQILTRMAIGNLPPPDGWAAFGLWPPPSFPTAFGLWPGGGGLRRFSRATLEASSHQLPDLRDRLAAPRQRLADEDGVGAGR